jgi:hypothetical protein
MTIELKIADIVGTGIWVASDDGQRVFDALAPALRTGDAVKLSFAGRELVITAFLNVAVGQIYGHPDLVEAARSRLSVVHADQSDLAKIKLVNDNAKVYFARKIADVRTRPGLDQGS